MIRESTPQRAALRLMLDGTYAALNGAPVFMGLTLPVPANGAQTGIVYKGALPFIHTFQNGDGNNTFVGLDAGNLTLGGHASAHYGHYNTMGGSLAGHGLRYGFSNAVWGHKGMSAASNDATQMAGLGNQVFRDVVAGSGGAGVGSYVAYRATTISDCALGGYTSCYSVTPAATQLTTWGSGTLYYLIDGVGNLALGFSAGVGDGATVNQRSLHDNYMSFLGYQSSRSEAVSNTVALVNGIAIGKNARVGASNACVIGGTGADVVVGGIGGVTAPAASWHVVGDITLTGGLYTGGDVATKGTLRVDATGNWQGAMIPATKGGTGLVTYAVGDLLYASTTGALSKLAGVAAGSYLASRGVGVAPAWATLNQAAIAGLTTASSPVFTGLTANGDVTLGADAVADRTLKLFSNRAGLFGQIRMAGASYAMYIEVPTSYYMALIAPAGFEERSASFWWGTVAGVAKMLLTTTVAGVLTLAGTGGFNLNGDLRANAALGMYATPATLADGDWQFLRSGADLLIQKRVSGAWVTKSTISGA